MTARKKNRRKPQRPSAVTVAVTLEEARVLGSLLWTHHQQCSRSVPPSLFDDRYGNTLRRLSGKVEAAARQMRPRWDDL